MSDYAVGFSTQEEAAAFEAANQEHNKTLLTERHKAMLDGNEHWCLTVVYGEEILVSHVLSTSQMIARALRYVDKEYEWGTDSHYLDEAMWLVDRFIEPDGLLERGYLPAETWDSEYRRDGEPDHHDMHVLNALEIPEYAFLRFREHKQSLDACLSDPLTRDWLVKWTVAVMS